MSTPRHDLPAPRQERSRATMQRICEATERLLDHSSFEQLTMQQIARAAKVAVGTIYTRFANKEALLPELFDRHNAVAAGGVDSLLEALASSGGLEDRVALVVGFAVDYHERKRGLLRALTTYVRAHPDAVPAELFAERDRQYRSVFRAVAGDAVDVARVEFGFSIVNAVCRESLLFGELSPPRGRAASPRALKQRLTEVVLLYATASTGAPGASARTPRTSTKPRGPTTRTRKR